MLNINLPLTSVLVVAKLAETIKNVLVGQLKMCISVRGSYA